MYLAVHAIAGIAISAHFSNPVLTFFLSLISHYLLDAIPHGDEGLREAYKNGQKRKYSSIIGVDLIALAILAVPAIFYNLPLNPWNTALGVVGGLLPDFLQLMYYLSRHPWLKGFFQLHEFFHYQKPSFSGYFPTGLVLQAGILALFFFLR